MPLYSKLPRTVAFGIEAVLPILVVALILVVVWLSFAVSTTNARQQTVACRAVNHSNDRTYDVFKRLLASGPRAHDPVALDGLHNLRLTYDAIAQDCRLGK